MSAHCFRYLDTDGDGTGTKNAIGTHAAAAEEYYIAGPSSGRLTIERMIVYVKDGAAFSAEKYGGAAALTNGILVKVTTEGELVDLTDGVPVKTNAGWSRLCHDVSFHTTGAGDDAMSVRWTFAKSGKPLVLKSATDKLAVIINDDVDVLTEHYFMVQGYYS